MVLYHGAPALAFAGLALVLPALLGAVFGLVPGRRIDLCRSVLVHAGSETVWTYVSNVPALHAAHGRANEFGRIADWSLRHGDGDGPGSVWRARGTWASAPYWADVEIVSVVRWNEVAIRLLRDSLGTQRGLSDHRASLSLDVIGPDATKITWRLSARLRGPRLLAALILSPGRVRARLLDQGLRSLKVEIESATRARQETRPLPHETGRLDVPAPAPPPRRPPDPMA